MRLQLRRYVVRMMELRNRLGGAGLKKAVLVGEGVVEYRGGMQTLNIYNIQVRVPLYKGVPNDITT